MASGGVEHEPSGIAVVGVSVSDTCGVRDHASLLAQELAREGMPCELHWLRRRQGSLRGSRSEVRAWSVQLARELREYPPRAVLLHYSVFSYAYKGLPLFVAPTLAAVRAPGVPIVAFMHELAYPWRNGGLRGDVWAASQRAVLRGLVDACSALVVTADFRADWLRTRRWLPARQVALAPVFSTLPAPADAPVAERDAAVIGLFGYSYEGAALIQVLDALGELRARGVRARLSLLGAPGRSSSAGERWASAARDRDLQEAVSFSGRLPAQELSDAIAACDVLVFADSSGPSSRKTTLAASLASGVALVAIDGRRRWSELTRREAVRVVAPTAGDLADAVARLLADEPARRALGARGREFANSQMSVASTARTVGGLLRQASGGSHL